MAEICANSRPERPSRWRRASTLVFGAAVRWLRWRWPWLTLCVAIALVGIGGLRTLQGMYGYPAHVDQSYLVNSAARMLKRGTLNPGFFRYPSLPIYFTAGSMSVGFLRANGEGLDRPLEVKKMGRVDLPFYKHATIVETARTLYTAIWLLIPVLLAACITQVAGLRYSAMAGVLLFSSRHYYLQRYLNVDVFGACAGLLVLAWILYRRPNPSLKNNVLIPGGLVGAAIACKYYLGLWLLPVILAGLFWGVPGRSPQRKVAEAAATVGVALFAFTLFTPFAILDLPAFLNDVGWEVHHYGVAGHHKRDIEPGWPHLVRNFRDVYRDLGLGVCALGVIGIVSTVRKDWRLGSVLLALPVLLLLFLARQKVHFERNLYSIIVLLVPFVALGAKELVRYGQMWLRRSSSYRAWLPLVGVLLLLSTAVPWRRALSNVQGQVAPQVSAARWIERNVTDATILVPKQTPINPELLSAGKIVRLDLKKTASVKKALKTAKKRRREAFVLLPRWKKKAPKNLRKGLEALGEHEREERFKGRKLEGRKTIRPEILIQRLILG